MPLAGFWPVMSWPSTQMQGPQGVVFDSYLPPNYQSAYRRGFAYFFDFTLNQEGNLILRFDLSFLSIAECCDSPSRDDTFPVSVLNIDECRHSMADRSDRFAFLPHFFGKSNRSPVLGKIYDCSNLLVLTRYNGQLPGA